MTEVWQWAADIVADWFLRRRAPRDAMAVDVRARDQPPAVRGAVVRTANAAIAARRRLEWALAGADLESLSPRVRAVALVLALQVETDAMLADAAERHFAAATSLRMDFAPVLRLAESIDAIADPVRRFATRHSLPDWLAVRLRHQYGSEAEALAGALGLAAPRTVRANTLRVASRADLATRLALAGVATSAARWAPLALHVEGVADLFATECYRQGAFEQQDEASQLAALAVAPPPGGRVLDLCAGSGGKALALAAALRNRGEILATDVHTGRLAALQERARRAGASNLRALAIPDDGLGGVAAEFAARADRIVIDAPCSGVGSWRRRPEARWSLSAAQCAALGAVQDALLDRAAAVLKPGARIVYATCSLLAEENELRVQGFLSRWPSFQLVRLAEVLGGSVARPVADGSGTFLSLRPDRHGCDGFFAAVLRRRRAD